VNQLLVARKEMEKMMKQMRGGKTPSLAQLQGNGVTGVPGGTGPRPSMTRRSKSKRKKKKSRR
jgi:hypothetical protein